MLQKGSPFAYFASLNALGNPVANVSAKYPIDSVFKASECINVFLPLPGGGYWKPFWQGSQRVLVTFCNSTYRRNNGESTCDILPLSYSPRGARWRSSWGSGPGWWTCRTAAPPSCCRESGATARQSTSPAASGATRASFAYVVCLYVQVCSILIQYSLSTYFYIVTKNIPWVQGGFLFQIF